MKSESQFIVRAILVQDLPRIQLGRHETRKGTTFTFESLRNNRDCSEAYDTRSKINSYISERIKRRLLVPAIGEERSRSTYDERIAIVGKQGGVSFQSDKESTAMDHRCENRSGCRGETGALFRLFHSSEQHTVPVVLHLLSILRRTGS